MSPFACVAALCLVPILQPHATAQEAPSAFSVTAGTVLLYAPAYPGADHYHLLLLPNLEFRFGQRGFASVREGIGYDLVSSDGWRIGPMLRYQFGRSEDEDNPFRIAGNLSDDLNGMGDLDGALEIGGYAEHSSGGFTSKLELRHGVSGHEGFVGDVQISYGQRTTALGFPIVASAGPRLRFAGESFNSAYFGVTAEQSARTGLAPHAPGAGLVSYGLGGTVTVPLSAGAAITVFAGYDRLTAGAADSPLVRRRGSPDQIAVGIGAGYRF